MGGAGDESPTTAGQDGRLGGGLGPPRRIECPRTMKVKRHFEKEAEGPSPKHFLSEEAMAERFTCLSLGNDHVYSTNGLPMSRNQATAGGPAGYQDSEDRLGTELEDDALDKDVELDGMFDMSDSRVLVLSPDLQLELSRPVEILPPEVLHSLNHPCMELLLWQPPGHSVHRAIRSLSLGLSDSETRVTTPTTPRNQERRAAEEDMDV
ncbi:uncharacterized protein LOC132383112 [Hypanus sabinus]|uniref:uncharacterized protein LOC132383112 n=1 Tax=Hypanus sabinus TaxID=79690 RepID=UPI0028C3B2D3|nr:uncharacterized protein LOC132383112 [Hypanus sabinus]